MGKLVENKFQMQCFLKLEKLNDGKTPISSMLSTTYSYSFYLLTIFPSTEDYKQIQERPVGQNSTL